MLTFWGLAVFFILASLFKFYKNSFVFVFELLVVVIGRLSDDASLH